LKSIDMKASSIILFCCAALALGQSSAGTFTATAAMAMARYGHTATFLNNGQVLIAGGGPNFYPSTGTFTATSEMIHGRECAKAHVLNNGKLLLSGGWDSDHVPDAELYDLTMGSFANAGAYATDPKAVGPCSGAASTLPPDGRVLIVWEDDLAEIYDPETARSPNRQTAGPSLNLGLATGTLLMDGKALVAGGDDGSSAYNFDAPTGSFAPGESTSASRDAGSATLLPNGTVSVAGGVGRLLGPLSRARRFIFPRFW
jgi:outer membrane protein assembly factor BamB